MALSLADELGDELDAHLASGDDTGLNASLGQSLADELDLDLDLDHGTTPSTSPRTGHERSPKLRPDGLPLPPVTPGPSPRRYKTSNTSTYYTATTSPGRLSNLDSSGEVERDLYALEESRGPSPEPINESERLCGDAEYDDAGLLTPARGGDLLLLLQEQINEQALFRDLLRTTSPDPSTSRQKMSYSLNRSRSTVEHEPGVEGALSRHVAHIEDAVKASEGHIEDLVGIRRDLAALSPFQLNADIVATMQSALERVDTQSTPASGTSVTRADDSPSTPTNALPSRREYPFAQPDHTPSAFEAISTAAQGLLDANKAVMSDCSALSETAEHHQAFLSATTRQIRGLKATVASFRERDEAEEHARRVIGDWERSQVERGLRGERSTKEVLDELVRGFQRVVRDCDLRMREIKAKSGQAIAAR